MSEPMQAQAAEPSKMTVTERIKRFTAMGTEAFLLEEETLWQELVGNVFGSQEDYSYLVMALDRELDRRFKRTFIQFLTK